MLSQELEDVSVIGFGGVNSHPTGIGWMSVLLCQYCWHNIAGTGENNSHQDLRMTSNSRGSSSRIRGGCCKPK